MTDNRPYASAQRCRATDTMRRPAGAEKLNFTWGRLFIPLVVPPPVIGMFIWNWKIASVWLIAVVAGARRA